MKKLDALKARRLRLANQIAEIDKKISVLENKPSRRSPIVAERNREAYELRKQGMRWKAIGKHFGVSQNRARDYVYRHLFVNPDADRSIIRSRIE